MTKKRSVLSVIAWVLLVSMLAMSAAGCSKNTEDNSKYVQRIAELEQENAALKSQIELLSAQIDDSSQALVLKTWDMKASAWPDSNGADVTLTAVPLKHEDGQTATFQVLLEDQEVCNLNCTWNGEAFTATAKLDAKDGYWYHCILTAADGTSDVLTLSTPIYPAVDSLVYLAASLHSYCNLVLIDAVLTGSELTIASGSVSLQLPRLSAGGEVPELKDAKLSLRLDGKEIGSKPVEMPDGENFGSYEAMISDISFTVPEDAGEGAQLELLLIASLSDGSEVSSVGASWSVGDDGLSVG